MSSVHLDKDVAKGIKILSKDECRTIKGQINMLVRNHLKEKGYLPTGNKKAEQASLATNCSASV